MHSLWPNHSAKVVAQKNPPTITSTLKNKKKQTPPPKKNNRGDLCYEAVASISDKLPQWGVNAARLIHDSLNVSFWTAEMSPSLGVLSAAHWACHYQITAHRLVRTSAETTDPLRRGKHFWCPPARRAKLLSPTTTLAVVFSFSCKHKI